MKLKHCATENGSREAFNEYENTKAMCTNGILPQFDTTTLEFSQSLPPQLTPPLNPSIYSSNGTRHIKSTPQQYLSDALSPSFHPVQKIDSSHSKSTRKSSQSSTPLFRPNSPSIKRNRSLPRVPGSRSNGAKKSFHRGKLPYLSSTPFYDLNEKTKLRKCFSEPCLVSENEFKETYLHKRRYSEKFAISTTKQSHLRVPTPKKPARNKIPSTNGQSETATRKLAPKSAVNSVPRSKNTSTPSKTIRPSPSDPTKKPENGTRRVGSKRKINQPTKVESPTKDAESQTDFDENVTNQSELREKTAKKQPKKKLGRTLVKPFSFEDSNKVWMEKKNKREKMVKKFEIKRWHRPPIVLRKQPFKITLPIEQKTTIPDPIKFQTADRQKKWEKYMKEFNERQEKLKKEKEHRAKLEMRNYRRTLIPRINKGVPYKKLGIKPMKAKISQYKQLREELQTIDPQMWQIFRKKYLEERQKMSNAKNKNKKISKQKEYSPRGKKPQTENISVDKNSPKMNPTNDSTKIPINKKVNTNAKNTKTSCVTPEIRKIRKKLSFSMNTSNLYG